MHTNSTFHSLGQDQSTVVKQAETTVTKCSMTSCTWARFLIGSNTLPGQRHSQPNWLCWVKDVCMFRCNLPPALLAEWPESFTCHCSNTGVERTPNKSQHIKLALGKKILPPLLPGFELRTFRSWVQCSNQEAILAPNPKCSCVHGYILLSMRSHPSPSPVSPQCFL